MPKKIVINDCSQCPHTDRGVFFGRISYIPSCVHGDAKELPYKKVVSSGNLQAKGTGVIPDWCPLADDSVAN